MHLGVPIDTPYYNQFSNRPTVPSSKFHVKQLPHHVFEFHRIGYESLLIPLTFISI
ncbi:hypothetical protein Hanom_Chr04g00350151 [Helianthus anomalus]